MSTTTSPSDGERTGILTAVDEEFVNLYDVPFVTVNKVDGLVLAEVLLSGSREIDRDRVETALSVGREHGVTAYARVFGDYGNVLIYFADDPDKGVIWAFMDELGGEWTL